MRKKRKVFIFTLLVFLSSLTLFLTQNDRDNPHQKEIYRSGLLLAGGANSVTQNYEPSLMYIDPNNNFSLKNIDFTEFGFDFAGIHEARPILIDNEYKIALGTYSNQMDNGDQAEFIILSNDTFGFDNLEVEFKEQVNDARIRAVFVGDINNDRKNEIVIGTRPNGILRYYKSIDKKWVGFDIAFLNETIHDILIADINRNGINEILITTGPRVGVPILNIPFQPLDSTGKIVSYELNPDTNTWQKEIVWDYIFRPQSLKLPKHARYLFASDVDGDGSKEIVANVLGPKNSGNDIELFRWDGLNYSREIVEDSLDIHASAITVGDIDSNGKDEILAFAKEDGALLLYNYEGKAWRRETLVDNLKNKSNTINYLHIINAPNNSHKKILYALGPIGGTDADVSSINTGLFYLEHTNGVWEKKYIDTTQQPFVVWGLFPAFPN